MHQIKYAKWPHRQQKDVNHFYKSHQQNVSCHHGDIIYTAETIDKFPESSSIIGVVFIRHLTHVHTELHLMRSLYIDTAYRNKGIAQQLIKQLLAENPLPVTTICAPNLTPFYLKLGFNQCRSNSILSNKYVQGFRQKGMDVLSYK